MIRGATEKRHKTATGNPNPKRAKSTQDAQEQPLADLEPPEVGKQPITEMIIRWGPGDAQKEYTIRVLLDSGATAPLLDKSWTEASEVPLVERRMPKPIEDFAGHEAPGAGRYHTTRLEIQHKKHYVPQASEVAPLGSDFDAILPAWWTERHKPSNMIADRIHELHRFCDPSALWHSRL